ncbi:MAG: TlpA family protein disulfide reductase [Acidimicrobiales bacterium]
MSPGGSNPPPSARWNILGQPDHALEPPVLSTMIPDTAATGLTASPPPTPTRRRPRRRTIFALVGLLAAAVTFAIVAAVVANSKGAAQPGTAPGPTLAVYKGSGPRAPQLRLSSLGGGSFDLAELGHRPIVVNFFASWCSACQSELSAVARVAKRSGVAFYGIDTNETSLPEARRLLARADATYPVGVGGTAQGDDYRVPGLPTTAFVSASGHIVAAVYGAVTTPELSRWVGELSTGKRLTP